MTCTAILAAPVLVQPRQDGVRRLGHDGGDHAWSRGPGGAEQTAHAKRVREGPAKFTTSAPPFLPW